MCCKTISNAITKNSLCNINRIYYDGSASCTIMQCAIKINILRGLIRKCKPMQTTYANQCRSLVMTYNYGNKLFFWGKENDVVTL